MKTVRSALFMLVVPVLFFIITGGCSDDVAPSVPESIHVRSVSNFIKVWDDDATGAAAYVSMWHPVRTNTWFLLGGLTVPVGYYNDPVPGPTEKLLPGYSLLIAQDGPDLAKPTGFTLIWKDTGSSGTYDVSIWRALPPAGFVALGDIAVSGYIAPDTNDFRCVRSTHVKEGVTGSQIWRDSGSGSDQDYGAFRILPASGQALTNDFFVGTNGYVAPTRAVYTLKPELLLFE